LPPSNPALFPTPVVLQYLPSRDATPHPKQFWMVGAGASDVWMVRPELKFGFWFHRHDLLGKRVVRIIQWFLVFNEPNRPVAVAKNL